MIPEFLSTLAALISSVVGGGQPLQKPPFFEDLDNKTNQVAEIARNMHQERLEFEGPSGSSGPTGTTGHAYISVTPMQKGPSGGSGPVGPTGQIGTIRLPAFNLRSGKMMPVELPQVAIDRSHALDYPTPTTAVEGPTGTTGATGNQGQNSGEQSPFQFQIGNIVRNRNSGNNK